VATCTSIFVVNRATNKTVGHTITQLNYWMIACFTASVLSQSTVSGFWRLQ